MATFSIAGEGVLDLQVAERVLAYLGHSASGKFDKQGKERLDASIPGFLNASRFSPWLIMRDLDNAACAPALLDQIAPTRFQYPSAMLRICVRSVEAWLLADRTGFARYFGVSLSRVPANPDQLANPKTALVNAVTRSRNRSLREGVTPRAGSGRSVGPEYNAVMLDYVNREWSIDGARANSSSLERAVVRIGAYQQPA
jgi:hypothetical protein